MSRAVTEEGGALALNIKRADSESLLVRLSDRGRRIISDICAAFGRNELFDVGMRIRGLYQLDPMMDDRYFSCLAWGQFRTEWRH